MPIRCVVPNRTMLAVLVGRHAPAALLVSLVGCSGFADGPSIENGSTPPIATGDAATGDAAVDTRPPESGTASTETPDGTAEGAVPLESSVVDASPSEDSTADGAAADATPPAPEAGMAGPLMAFVSGYAPNLSVFQVEPASGTFTLESTTPSFGTQPSWMAVSPDRT